MPDSEHTDDPLVLVELVDDPVGADANRPQPTEPTPERMTRFGFPFEEAEGHDDGVGQRPVEVEHLSASPPDELDPAHLRVSEVELLAQLIEAHGLPALGFVAALVDRGEGVGVGEDLGGLFQCLVLVDGDQHRGGPAPAGDDDVLSQVGDLVDDLAELAA